MSAADIGQGWTQAYDVDHGVEVGRFSVMVFAALLVGLVLAQAFVIAVGPPQTSFAFSPPPSPLVRW